MAVEAIEGGGRNRLVSNRHPTRPTCSNVWPTYELSLEERDALNNALVQSFGVDAEKITAENISAAVSTEMKNDAIWATIWATLLMLIYIFIRFKKLSFALDSVLALVHDVLILVTCYAIARWSVGSTFIACILTIVGYSIKS